jgi:hypothetical protein
MFFYGIYSRAKSTLDALHVPQSAVLMWDRGGGAPAFL